MSVKLDSVLRTAIILVLTLTSARVKLSATPPVLIARILRAHLSATVGRDLFLIAPLALIRMNAQKKAFANRTTFVKTLKEKIFTILISAKLR